MDRRSFLLAGLSAGQTKRPSPAGEVFVRGAYSHPGAFWKTGARLDEYGINAVFVHSGSINAELVARVRGEGAKLYAEFATLNGKGYVEKNPEAWPVNELGEKAPAATWFLGACPTEPGFRAYRLKLLAELLERYEIDGVWMDYLHWHAQFEDPDPVLPETCFSASCVKDFARKTGVRVPDGSAAQQAQFILGRHEQKWRDWRCSVLAEWAREIRAVLRKKRPGLLLGNYQCPWTDADFNGARRRTLGIDLDMLAPLVDVMSPMVYHKRMGRAPGWVGESVEWLSRRVRGRGPQVWPIVQAQNEPGVVSAEEFADVLRLARSAGAGGVMMFTIGSVAQDPAKMKVLKEVYGRWAR